MLGMEHGQALSRSISAVSAGDKRAVGRRPHVFDLEKVEDLAELDCTLAEMAVALGCSERTFREHRAHDPALQAAVDRGRARGAIELRRAQHMAAHAGNPTMLIWLGKQRLGQRNFSRTELTRVDRDAVEVEVSPAIQEPDQLAEIVAGLAELGVFDPKGGD